MYSSEIPPSACFPNSSPNDSTTSINKIGQYRGESTSSTNLVKNAVIRRTDELDDPTCLPMSGSTVSLTSNPSKLSQHTYPTFGLSAKLTSNEECDENEIGLNPHLLKDVSPTKLLNPKFLHTSAYNPSEASQSSNTVSARYFQYHIWTY